MDRLVVLSLIAGLAQNPAFALACAEAQPPRFDGGDPGLERGVSISVGRLADLIWVPLLIDGAPVPEDAGLSLKIGFDGTITGTTGCNRFAGTAEMDAGELVIGPLAVTEMACVEPERMGREAAYLKALGEVRWFVFAAEGLWLTREDGTVAVCLW